MEMYDELRRGADALGLSLSEQTLSRLCDFGAAVLRQNEIMNLTAITEPRAFARLHLCDSLTLLRVAQIAGRRVIDVGCGAGFPGVPLIIACESAELTLLDSLGKRVRWLSETLPALGVRAECLNARAEEAVCARREQYDFAVSRAVARLNVLLELTAPYVRVGGEVLAMKGSAAREELAEAERAIRTLGLRVARVETFPAVGEGHTVIVLQKIAKTPAAYPRKYAKIKQSPL